MMSNQPPNPEDEKPYRPGRPVKLTDEITLGIVQALEEGSHRVPAAKLFGIGSSTLRRWMQLGKQFPEGNYGQLRAMVLEAEAEWERKAVRAIHRAGMDDDPSHLEWLLERKYPQRWGRYRGELGELKKRIKQLEGLIGELAGEAAP